MQDAKEEVRSRLNIEDVIGEYVQLKRAGRNFKGLSPFSGEKTPSFYVSPEKHIWHDFSSGKGGDVFSFVMEVEGLDFRASLEQLARKAGVDLSQYQSGNDRQLAQRKKRLYEALELATSYFQHSLLKNPHALEYVFKKRGLNKQIVQDFRLGYAPTTSDALVQFLVKKGFNRKELDDAGLTNRFGGDLFRGRMTVPLLDPGGRVVGFTARILADDEPNAPKYLNTPQTLLYDKSRHVFGLTQAKETIRTKDRAVIVEGNMDVISSHQAGVKEVVATAGTAMTEQHLHALRRLSGNIALAFDGDKAGLNATERAIPIASRVGVELTIITLPDNAKDPDELIKQDVSAWQQAITQAMPAVDWLLDRYRQQEDMTTARGKRTFTTAALAVVGSLADPVERDHYENKIAEITGSSLAAIHAKLTATPVDEKQPMKHPVVSAHGKVVDAFAYQDNILAAALFDPTIRHLLAQTDPAQLAGEHRQAVASFVSAHTDPIESTPDSLQIYDTYVKILLLKAETRYGAWSSEERAQEMAHLLRQVTNEHRKQTKEQLVRQLQSAEQSGDDEQAQHLRTQLNTLIKETNHG